MLKNKQINCRGGKDMTILELAKKEGYTKEQVKACVDELINKGVSKGCYQDFGLLALVIQVICEEAYNG